MYMLTSLFSLFYVTVECYTEDEPVVEAFHATDGQNTHDQVALCAFH